MIEGVVIKSIEACLCQSNLERSLAMVTALAPEIGYDQAAKIAKIAYETGRTLSVK